MRRIIAMIEVDDDKAIAEDLGTIEYLEREFGWLENSGVYLQNARILDDDDKYDSEFIDLADKIFRAIRYATFTSIWDGGLAITTSCKINMDTKQVFDIEIADVDPATLEVLEYEYVTIDGCDYSVSRDENTEYWYE